jgi:phage tail sheath protein FI
MINVLKSFLYQSNNASLRQQVINSTTPIMDTLKASNGVTDYRIVCDETNNTDVIVNSGKLVLDVYCTFIYPAVTITLRILASDTGEVVDTQTV